LLDSNLIFAVKFNFYVRTKILCPQKEMLVSLIFITQKLEHEMKKKRTCINLIFFRSRSALLYKNRKRNQSLLIVDRLISLFLFFTDQIL